jgi:hypothetical protein
VAGSLDLSGNPLSQVSLEEVLPEIVANNPGRVSYDVPEPATLVILMCAIILVWTRTRRSSVERNKSHNRSFATRILCCFIVGSIAFSFGQATALSSTITWIGTNEPNSNLSWSNPNYWDPRTVPTSSDDVIIDSNGMSFPFLYVDCYAKGIAVSCSWKGIILEPGSNLTVYGDGLHLGGGASTIEANSTLDTRGPTTLSWASLDCYGNHMVTGNVFIAGLPYSSGTYSLRGNGNMNYFNTAVFYVGYSGTGTFNQLGSGSVYTGGLYVGYVSV